MKLPNLRQFDRYWVDNKHDNENGTDYADKREAPVIYVLYIDEVVAYIGMSMNIWQRFKQHRLSPQKSLFTSFAFYEFEHATKEQLQFCETLYIRYYDPIWNKDKGKRLKSTDFVVTFSKYAIAESCILENIAHILASNNTFVQDSSIVN